MSKEIAFKLIQDIVTMKEAFIIEELQAYMDLSDPANPKWVVPVRLRLQEKKDWKKQVAGVIEKALLSHKSQSQYNAGVSSIIKHYHDSIVDFIENELKERLEIDYKVVEVCKWNKQKRK